ncbi:MAG: PadR family transcriptional regulator [Gemmatimonadetes bacterium]|nr:PadR family transcriptional regulator [Gemmatimonadota bacterium]NNL30978.1 PadR family transcriptional regulator [Gemmatimonadota bacterium]
MTRLDILQGTLDLLVLRTLVGGPRHGYQIARAIKDTSDDVLQVEEGALYPALHRIEGKGWIEASWGVSENNRRAKFYALTVAGREALDAQARSWNEYVAAVSRVMDPAEEAGR